jgi:hypothetical protein
MLAVACTYINAPGLQPNTPVVSTAPEILKEAYAMKPGTQKGVIIDHGDGLPRCHKTAPVTRHFRLHAALERMAAIAPSMLRSLP